MKRFLSIRVKIFLFILFFMVVPILIITYVSNYNSARSILEQTKINDLQTIDCLQENMDTLLNSVEGISGVIARDANVIDFLERSGKLEDTSPDLFSALDSRMVTGSFTEHFGGLKGISLADPEGRFVGEKVYNTQQFNWYFNKTFFRSCPENGSVWSKPFLAVEQQEDGRFRALSCVTPVMNGGERLGYLILTLDIGFLDEMIANVTGNTYVVNDGGAKGITQNTQTENYIIGSKDHPAADTFNANFYYTSKINYSYLVNNSSVITTSNGIKVTVTTKKYDRMQWIYLIVSPFDQISQTVLNHLTNIFALCAGCIVFAVISAFLISKLVTKPIFSLNKTMNKVRTGDLAVRHTDLPHDEIGNLGRTFNNLLDQIQTLMKDISTQQKNKRKLQLQLIQAQVKPHFLYNVLEMISSFIRDDMKTEALASISHLAHFYRTSLSNGSDIITVEQEADLIENYLTLQRLRYIEFMDFTLSINPCIHHYKIPKLTLQPLVENAIYHGLKKKCEKGMLCVVGYKQEERIYFEIYDDGAGMSPETLQSVLDSLSSETVNQDFGISSVMKRLNIHFNNQAGIEIKSEENQYTNLVVSFPAIEL